MPYSKGDRKYSARRMWPEASNEDAESSAVTVSAVSDYELTCEPLHEYARRVTSAIRHSLNNASRVVGLNVVAGQDPMR